VQRQQMRVGHLSRAPYAVAIDQSLVGDRHIVGPETILHGPTHCPS
jgi:hypothetical protein